MKILQINAVYGFKSTGVIVKDIGETLKAHGDEGYFAYQAANGAVENGYLIGNKLDWKFHALHARLFGKQAYASRRATKKFLRWVDEIKPDVVHLHNLHSNYVNFNLLCDYLAKKDIPTVVTMHDCWYFTGKCSHYVAAKCDRWQTACGNCPLKKAEQPSLFFDATKKVLEDRVRHLLQIKRLTLVGCSEWIAGEVKKSKLQTADVQVVYNGVDTAIFTPHESDFRERHGLADEFTVMGMADKWCNEQNAPLVEKLITALGENTKIVLVGCSEEQKKRFEKHQNVVTVGYVTDREPLSDIYAAADVFVNLTHADTLPTVNMESICCGTPVITFDCCGSPELVDKDSGYVVKEGDEKELLASIEKIRKEGKDFDVQEKQNGFDKNQCYKKYLEIYKRISEKSV